MQSSLGQQPGVAVLSCALGRLALAQGSSWQHHGTQPVPCSPCSPWGSAHRAGGEERSRADTRAEEMVSGNETIIRFSKALAFFSLVAKEFVVFVPAAGGSPAWKAAEMMLLFYQCSCRVS